MCLRVCRDIHPGTELLLRGDTGGKLQAADEAADLDTKTRKEECAGTVGAATRSQNSPRYETFGVGPQFSANGSLRSFTAIPQLSLETR